MAQNRRTRATNFYPLGNLPVLGYNHGSTKIAFNIRSREGRSEKESDTRESAISLFVKSHVPPSTAINVITKEDVHLLLIPS